MTTHAIQIGDRVRIVGIPAAPILTVVSLYLEDERMYASCSWKKGVQEVAFPLSELVLVDK